MVAPTRLEPRTDISVRTMLARLEATLGGVEQRLTEGHAALAVRLDKIEDVVADTRQAVSRIEGERVAERRAKANLGTRAWASLVGAIAAGLAALATVWATMTGQPIHTGA